MIITFVFPHRRTNILWQWYFLKISFINASYAGRPSTLIQLCLHVLSSSSSVNVYSVCLHGLGNLIGTCQLFCHDIYGWISNTNHFAECNWMLLHNTKKVLLLGTSIHKPTTVEVGCKGHGLYAWTTTYVLSVMCFLKNTR